MSLSINDVVIDSEYIEEFKELITGLVLRVGAPALVGRAIYHGLKGYKEGDVVQINDFYKFRYSGSFVIKQIESIINSDYRLTLVLHPE